jgi:hypothetical protein
MAVVMDFDKQPKVSKFSQESGSNFSAVPLQYHQSWAFYFNLFVYLKIKNNIYISSWSWLIYLFTNIYSHNQNSNFEYFYVLYFVYKNLIAKSAMYLPNENQVRVSFLFAGTWYVKNTNKSFKSE